MAVKNKELLKSLGIFTDFNLKNITRIGSKKVNDGWWVRISRDGVKTSKTFTDEEHGGAYFSLKQAVLYRDRFAPQKAKSNTGYNNLSISIYGNNKSPMVRASYKSEEKSFNISSYGYGSALKEGMQWLNNKDDSMYGVKIKINLDAGLTYLNKKLPMEQYLPILEKTILYQNSDGDYYIPKKRQKTILILTDKNSNVISKDKNFTYNKYVKDTLKHIHKNGFDFQIENNDDYSFDEKDYYAVVKVSHNTSSKEFCFRVGKLVNMSKKEFYAIQKTAPFFKTIYKDNPNVKKNIINIIPDFKSIDELQKYLLKKKEELKSEKRELVRKKDANRNNKDYAARKDKQIGYVTKEICDYDRLYKWSSRKEINQEKDYKNEY